MGPWPVPLNNTDAFCASLFLVDCWLIGVTRFFFVVIALVLGMVMPAQAMKLMVHGNRLYATGPVVGSDATEFSIAFDNPRIDTVVLVNSPGGVLRVGFNIGNLIRLKRYKTVAVGYCSSACSLLFMGGVERRFSSVLPPELNFIGIHGAYSVDTRTRQAVKSQASMMTQSQMEKFYADMMGSKFHADIIRQSLQDMESSQDLLKVPESQRKPQTIEFCRSTQRLASSCTAYPKVSAFSMGVVTDNALDDVALPRSFLARSHYLDLDWNAPIFELTQHLQPVLQKYCLTAECLAGWAALYDTSLENKALATPDKGQGMGFIRGASSPTLAMISAVFACNHSIDTAVRLCKAIVLNDQDLTRVHQAVNELHAQASSRLRALQASGEVDEGPSSPVAVEEELRSNNMTGATPLSLPRVTTLTTQALVNLIRNKASPTLIDVGSELTTLPQAQWLVNGGIAYADPMKDEVFNLRFAKLLALLAPSKEDPVVFFGSTANNWHAVNAARRAQRLGYTQVMWYRGGHASWRAAQLPTAPQRLQAVVD